MNSIELKGDPAVPKIILDRNISEQIKKIERYTIGENCVTAGDYSASGNLGW